MNNIMETIGAVCTQVRNKTSRGTSFRSLLTKIRREFRIKEFDLIIRSHRKENLDREEFYVNAYYDPENDSNFDIPIEVVIIHNFDKTVIWDKSHITNLLIQVYDAIVHELKHQKQSRKKHYKIYWPHSNIVHNYLSDPDEIDAYAISIAIELCRNMGKHRALHHMHRFTSMSRYKIQHNLVSPNLYAYVKIFKDLSHPVLQRLAKKIYVHLRKVDTDKIFL